MRMCFKTILTPNAECRIPNTEYRKTRYPLVSRMKLHEYQSKELLARFGVPVARGEVTSDPREAGRISESLGGKVVVKAQVLMGGRGKAGGVKLFDNAADAERFTKELI